MKTRWNKRRLVPVALLMALALICGSVFAYMFSRTEDKTTKFIPAKVSCKVAEEFDPATGVKSSIKVTNTGNIDAYLRVRLVTYWVDADGKVAPKSSPALSITPANGWVEGSDNTFYYKEPVAPDGVTDDLLNGSITLEADAEGNRQVVDVFAEAIQAKPANAVTESWDVTLDDGGTITAAQ